ncbi:hypothetical protein FA95DRAFT_1602653 [Auriscalpium vulgare]|uniref:Uncharacterized protein n=1 Tax=Auriscalpium vulgare TaxID=40419 RepID=A0ACB8S5E8_9AGAM|nr:hypothetical protein FA95DRAFT_1602653 [Auriscalpium vulgare]
MDRLADELIQLIFNELNDPSSLSSVSKRYYHFSQDPYVRAHYFIARYGNIQAFYGILGRGKLVNERVIDILLSSGAHLSRYLVQVAVHHYFRSSCPFIKVPWVRSLPFPTFTHFINAAAAKFGDVPTGKSDDDGTVFSNFVKESRLPATLRLTKPEDVMEILEKYKFIPFCDKDPITAQFPLALAAEPRLLPLAIANGFIMDRRYRDFVFRRMFEHSAEAPVHSSDEILHNVRELCRLDTSMFVSRTVAAEVLMEAQANEQGYTVLKTLNRSGELKFDLSSVVEELIKLFVNTRSVLDRATGSVFRHLWKDFPSKDPIARLVMLLTFFAGSSHPSVSTLHSELKKLKMLPITRQDIFRILVNPFVECWGFPLKYAKTHCGFDEEEITDFIKDVAVHCLEVSAKGKMLLSMYEAHRITLDGIISDAVTKGHQISLEDLPAPDDEAACQAFEAKLCQDPSYHKEQDLLPLHAAAPASASEVSDNTNSTTAGEVIDSDVPVGASRETDLLGHVGQLSLSQRLRSDDLAYGSRRGRYLAWSPSVFTDFLTFLPYPSDYTAVGRWVLSEFGRRHPVTAVFMTHAVINMNTSILLHYTGGVNHVPITLMHFKLLARLGRCPSSYLFTTIQSGAEFFFSDEDYLDATTVKKENSPTADAALSVLRAAVSPSPTRVKSDRESTRQFRRSAAAVKSYAVPDSDDEDILTEKFSFPRSQDVHKRKLESNLQRWIKHLLILQKEELKKYNEMKKRLEKANNGIKLRIPKNEFLRALSTGLRDMRKFEQTSRLELHGHSAPPDVYSEGDDDDDEYRTRPVKRRKTAHR